MLAISMRCFVAATSLSDCRMVSASFAFARPAICRFSVVFGMGEIMSDNRSAIMVTFEHLETDPTAWGCVLGVYDTLDCTVDHRYQPACETISNQGFRYCKLLCDQFCSDVSHVH